MQTYRGKRIDNGEWVYGYYSKRNITCIREDDVATVAVDVIYEEDGLFPMRVHPASVSQSTGLKDKNGTEIFGGDIVEAVGQEVVKVTDSFRKMKAGIYNFVVFWDESFSQWGFKHPIGSIHPDMGIREYKIIGNTTDNPTLLKGE